MFLGNSQGNRMKLQLNPPTLATNQLLVVEPQLSQIELLRFKGFIDKSVQFLTWLDGTKTAGSQ